MRCERSIQPAAVQLRISPTPHSVSTTSLSAIDGGFRQHAERVAVEIDRCPSRIDAIQRELSAQRRQLIARVLVEAVSPGDHGSDRSTARTGEAHAWVSFSGNAINS